MAGAPAEALEDAQRRLGFVLPDDYRTFMARQNGVEGWFGEMYMTLFPIEGVPELNEAHDHGDVLPGFVAFGSDGAGELFGFDFRSDPPPVVMVGNVSGGWRDAIVQAPSFQAFMEHRRRGRPFDFGV